MLNNLLTDDGEVVRLWQDNEPIEVEALRFYMNRGWDGYGIRKVDGLNVVEKRTGLDKRWKLYVHGHMVTSKDTEADLDTFIGKLKTKINAATMDTSLLKKCADV